MADEQTAAPETSAVRVALWRAMHVELDPPPHVLDDEIARTWTQAVPRRVQTDVGGDPLEPRPEGPRPIEGVEPAPSSQQRVLERIFRVGTGAQHPVAVPEERALVRCHDRAAGVFVSA